MRLLLRNILVVEKFVAIMGNKKLGAIELKPKENFMIIKLNIVLKQN